MKRLNQVRGELEVLEGRWAASTLLDCAPTQLGPRANKGEDLAVTAEVATTAKSTRDAFRHANRQATANAAAATNQRQQAPTEPRTAVRSLLAASLQQDPRSLGRRLQATPLAASHESKFLGDEGGSGQYHRLSSQQNLVGLPELAESPGIHSARFSVVADWTGSGGPSVANSSLPAFSVNVTVAAPETQAFAAPAVDTTANYSGPFVPEENSGGDKVTAAAKPGSGGGGGGTTTTTFAYWRVDAVPAPATTINLQGGLALVGGSTDVDAVFTWMEGRAGGGDFLVLRATGTDAYNSYIDGLTNMNSVATLLIGDRNVATTNTSVVNYIDQAEAIFIAGGDQADYENFWANTPVEDAIYRAIGRGVPLGGTSAGLAILGEVDYTAVNGSITSREALKNPLDSRITLSTSLLGPTSPASVLNLLDNVITDSHFEQRDRMGRLLTFMARADRDIAAVGADPRGIAINEQTALLVSPTGQAEIVGNPNAGVTQAVYFLDATPTSVPAIAAKKPLTYEDINVVRANVGDTFNVATWTGGSLSYQLDVVNGAVVSTRPTMYG